MVNSTRPQCKDVPCKADGSCWRDKAGTEWHPGFSYGVYRRSVAGQLAFVSDLTELSTRPRTCLSSTPAHLPLRGAGSTSMAASAAQRSRSGSARTLAADGTAAPVRSHDALGGGED